MKQRNHSTPSAAAPIDSNLSGERPPASDKEIDGALVRRAANRDESAFVEIMNRYQAKIYALTLGRLHNHADAEEITQETFIRAHRGIAQFRGESSLSTWLYRIAINLSRNRYWYIFRRRGYDSLSLDHPIGADQSATFADLVADGAPDPARETAVQEFTDLVERCMQQLDPQQREILVLRNVLNRSYEEIAAELGIALGTVKSRIARARERLRVRLAELCPDFAPDSSAGDWFLPVRAAAVARSGPEPAFAPGAFGGSGAA
jgi:RNA polymerase sigma-70 factor (ECF subfamily)